MTDLCTYHRSIVAAAVRAGHLDDDAATRLATDLARSCRPGRWWCPPIEPATDGEVA